MNNVIKSECCGRSFKTAGDGGNFNNNCIQEYSCTMPACIRNKQPDCTAAAVIPSITVDTVDGITNLANCFVHVNNINTTFYIDDKHRIMIVWAGNVETDKPTGKTPEELTEILIENELGLRSQYLFWKSMTEGEPNTIEAFYYDKTGKPYSAGTFEEVEEETV